MAIDTEAKRRSAVATRRLPWMRRFTPLPDGTISQGDRQSLAFVYSGILADAPIASPTEPPGACEMRRTIGAVVIRRSGPGSVAIQRSGPGASVIREV